MKKYVYISIGGFAGAILRYSIKTVPFGTLIVNIAGCLIIGFILTLALEILDFNSDLRLGIATGFLGALTTFGTICKETTNLIINSSIPEAVTYVVCSTIMGLISVYLGYISAKKIVAGRVKK